jgi:hypothetical protein
MQSHFSNESDDRRLAGVRRTALQEVCLFDDSGEPFLLETNDLSASGMFVCSDVLLEPGQNLWVSFTIPNGPKLVVRGKVVRGHLGGDGKPSGMGVEFVDLTAREEAWLRKFTSDENGQMNLWQLFVDPHEQVVLESSHAK